MDLAAEDEDCSVKDGWNSVERRNGMPVGSRDVPGKRNGAAVHLLIIIGKNLKKINR